MFSFSGCCSHSVIDILAMLATNVGHCWSLDWSDSAHDLTNVCRILQVTLGFSTFSVVGDVNCVLVEVRFIFFCL